MLQETEPTLLTPSGDNFVALFSSFSELFLFRYDYGLDLGNDDEKTTLGRGISLQLELDRKSNCMGGIV